MQPVGAGLVVKYDAAALARVRGPLSEAQAEAGNYRKAHLRAFGLDIAIENSKGSVRRKLTNDGEEKWRVTMPAHYGYIKGTTGADGDHVDVYLGPDEKSGLVWVVDQIRPQDGSFDEHKCLLGFPSYERAVKAYLDGFSDGSGKSRVGAVVEMDLTEFKDWLKGDTSKPLAYEGKLAKSWDETKHFRDRIGRFASKNGGKAAIGAAAVGLAYLAGKALFGRSKERPIVNESQQWAQATQVEVEQAKRAGRETDARILALAVKAAEDEPAPAHPKSLGAKAKPFTVEEAAPIADIINTHLSGEKTAVGVVISRSTKPAQWEQKTDGLTFWSLGSSGVNSRSLYQDANGDRTARIDLIWMNHEGGGAAHEGLNREVAAYKKLGVKRVALHANLDIGAYAWARMGFTPGPKSWKLLQADLSDVLDRGAKSRAQGKFQQFTPKVEAHLRSLIESDDPKTLWKIVDYRPNGWKVGKDLMSKMHWFGSLDLNDAQAMARFNAYTDTNKRIAA